MDYIIFRKAENDFMRFSPDPMDFIKGIKGDIFVTADEDEIKNEFQAETNFGTEPVIFSLSYEHYFDSEMNENQKVTIFDKTEKVGFFTYKSCFNDDDAFYDALEDWAEDYINNNLSMDE